MKQLFLTVTLLVTCAITSNAQSEKYYAAMGQTLGQYGGAKTNEELQDVAAKLERVANAEKNQWLPYYYLSQAKSRISMNTKGDAQDLIADEAIKYAVMADSLNPKNSEVYCILSMANSAKMMVNPRARYMDFGAKSQKYLEEAKAFDATNPRPYALQAIGTKNTPKIFGGGCDKALPIAQKGAGLFSTFKTSDAIQPNWGKEIVEDILTNCK